MIENFTAQLEKTEMLSPSTRTFRFRREAGIQVDFKPGQFFRFTFHDGDGDFERSYSLCNLLPESADEGILDLVISTVENGRASKLLFSTSDESIALSAGVKGPFGRLVLPPVLPARLFLVGTSVGIAPFMPMLAELATALEKEQIEVFFLYGIRDKSEAVYADELREFARNHANFHLQIAFSRETEATISSGLDGDEFSGYVTARVADLKPNAGTDYFLLCGNPHMVDDVFTLLKSEGLNQRQVIREKYVFAVDSKSKSKPQGGLSDAQKKLIAEKMNKYKKN